MPESLSTVRVDVLLRLGDSTNDIWTNAEIDRYIQEGYDELLIRTKMLWKRAYSNDVASTATYSLPTDFIGLDRVLWNWRRIEPVTQQELIDFDALYRTTEGPVQAYSVESDGLLTLRKYPVPSTTATAGADANNTRIEYFARGTAVSADADGFSIPDRYVKYIRHFAMFRALERNGTGQDLVFAAHWKARFDEGIMRIINRMQKVERTRRVGYGERRVHLGPPPRPKLPRAYGREVRYP